VTTKKCMTRSARQCVLLGAALLLAVPVPVPARQDASTRHECFMMSRVGDPNPPLVSDQSECSRPSAPASTFKIPHALIALETGAITATSIVKWDGTPYEFKSWRRDHTLESAIRSSVLPFFQHTARLIGPERMRKRLESLAYATDSFDGDVTRFWINGDLVVSPSEQFTFLQRLFSGALPAGAAHTGAVIEALRMPRGQILLGSGARPFVLEWPPDPVVRAKTGNTIVNGERVSWLVGSIETAPGRPFVFVARARSNPPLDNTAGAEVARRWINKLVAPMAK
jgi:beta-lactamase class D